MKVYLDSSIFNAKIASIYCPKRLLPKTDKEKIIENKKKIATEKLINYLIKVKDIIYISDVVLDELNKTPVYKRKKNSC